MLPKYKMRKGYILDKIHRGAVNVCIATTIVTSVLLGIKVYEYFRYVRPLRKTMQLKSQEELLAEGRYLQDMATDITSYNQTQTQV